MIIGIPKEIKNNENRVSLTPSGAKELTKRGHKVYVQATAGANSGFPDKDYVAAGAELLPTIEEVYAKAEMIIKVKEPIEPEYKLIRQGQLVFTYFHFASSEPLTRAMVESGAICCAYETVEASDRSLPLLIPMSEVAGRMATQEGCYFLEKPHGGKGKLLGGMPGVKPAKVFVIGAGVVGTAAARMAAGLGADVTICDISLKRLAYLTDVMPQNVKTLMSSEYNIREELKTADLVIGSVLIPGAKAPKLVTRDNAAVRHPTGGQGLASRLQGESRTGVRIERRRRKGRLQTSSGCLGTEIRTAGPVKPTPQTIQSENPAIAALPTLWSPSFRTERQSLVFFSEYEAFV